MENSELCNTNKLSKTYTESVLPIFEIISLIEREQKHPVAEILYSFAVKEIEEKNKRENFNSNNKFLSTQKNINQDSNGNKEAIYLINNSLKITSNGIEAKIKWQKKELLNKLSSNNQIDETLSVLIGNPNFIFDQHKINLSNQKDSKNLKELLDKIASNSFTNIFLCINKQISAVFFIDTSSIIRPEINFVLNELRSQNKKTIILSGDNNKSVEDVAEKLHFSQEDYYGEINHLQKKKILQDLKNKNKNFVLMIGDGINDVLSLTEANYGISFNANSQLNLIASDIIFIKEDLRLILSLLKLSKLTFVFIWINIFWAFVYNIVMIPIVSGVFYKYSEFLMSPTISSLSMLCSSLLIIFTSNLLRLFNIDYIYDSYKDNNQSIKENLYLGDFNNNKDMYEYNYILDDKADIIKFNENKKDNLKSQKSCCAGYDNSLGNKKIIVNDDDHIKMKNLNIGKKYYQMNSDENKDMKNTNSNYHIIKEKFQ